MSAVGWIVGGPSSGFSVSSAMSFMPSGTVALKQIDVAFSITSGTNAVTLTLNSDTGGLPGGVLMSWAVSGLPVFATCCTVETLTPDSPVTLTSGTRYWIVASAATDAAVGWNINNTGSTGLLAQETPVGSGFFYGGGAYVSKLGPSPLSDQPGAFDVIGNAVPEPATVAFYSCGLALLAFFAECADTSRALTAWRNSAGGN